MYINIRSSTFFFHDLIFIAFYFFPYINNFDINERSTSTD